MKLYSVTFDDTDVVVLEPGLELSEEEGERAVNFGTDVGGATLAMISLRVAVAEADVEDERVVRAGIDVNEDGRISFVRHQDSDRKAFVLLSVIQRSPDARTEIEPYSENVSCIGNAFEKPMDRQLLVFEPGASVRFRRFERGGNFGPWETISWDGQNLSAARGAVEGN